MSHGKSYNGNDTGITVGFLNFLNYKKEIIDLY